MRAITIIGLGQVGSNLAAQLLASDSVDQLDLLDQSDERAVGVATDLGDAYPDAAITSQDWSSVSRADIVVVALGKRDLIAADRFGELALTAQADSWYRDNCRHGPFTADDGRSTGAVLQCGDRLR